MSITPTITLQDNLSGVDSTKTVVLLDGNNVQQGEAIPLYELQLGPHAYMITASDLAGNISSHSVTFETSTSIQSLQDMISSFTSAGWIDNTGISNSQQKKLNNNAQRLKHCF
ncbi:hypothetical protein FHS19_000022 [Paenibacillus rhizosphaerae]|uniref:Bacterial Ig-like domain-containing protein n=1 Tax=Paenibacillus rhizosphaerae TaxID=297318 RepID=A0A839TJ06_9BACL|nr:hypothetical protein [Paenibacillus rhizosphaerae]